MITCVLSDIEGTTSSIEFVHKVLFPYSKKNFSGFLANSTQSEVTQLISQVWIEHLGGEVGSKPDLTEVIKQLQSWTDMDVKNPILKNLQGKIWQRGYETKAYFGHVYPEVKDCLVTWKKSGMKLAIYSSGSVEAQKLLFKHSEAGDLTPLFANYFDTAVGHKREVGSYEGIAKLLNFSPGSILFLSDIKEELDAAGQAGLKTCQLMRDPKPVPGHHQQANDFNEVDKLFLQA